MASVKDPAETAKPEEHIREESLHKASTDLTAFDVSDAPPDIWVVESTVLVRADSEDGAKSKLLAAYGVAFDSKDVKVRPAKAADLK